MASRVRIKEEPNAPSTERSQYTSAAKPSSWKNYTRYIRTYCLCLVITFTITVQFTSINFCLFSILTLKTSCYSRVLRALFRFTSSILRNTAICEYRFNFGSPLSLASLFRRNVCHQQPSGQAVVTGRVLSPPASTCVHIYRG